MDKERKQYMDISLIGAIHDLKVIFSNYEQSTMIFDKTTKSLQNASRDRVSTYQENMKDNIRRVEKYNLYGFLHALQASLFSNYTQNLCTHHNYLFWIMGVGVQDYFDIDQTRREQAKQ